MSAWIPFVLLAALFVGVGLLVVTRQRGYAAALDETARRLGLTFDAAAKPPRVHGEIDGLDVQIDAIVRDRTYHTRVRVGRLAVDPRDETWMEAGLVDDADRLVTVVRGLVGERNARGSGP